MMGDIMYSQHGQCRMQQRGITAGMIETVLIYGRQSRPDAYFLRKKDVQREVKKLKNKVNIINQCKRSRPEKVNNIQSKIKALLGAQNKEVVVSGNRMVTCYHRAKKRSCFVRRRR
jgi:peptidoglycan hydrolase CwlO-like protein